MPVIYSYKHDSCVEISDGQVKFFHLLASYGWDVNRTIPEVVKQNICTQSCLDQWMADKIFWPEVREQILMHTRSDGLTEEYVKSKTLAVANGKAGKVSQAQVQAIALAARIVGLGNSNSRARLEITKDKVSIDFGDIDSLPLPMPEKPAIEVLDLPKRNVIDIKAE